MKTNHRIMDIGLQTELITLPQSTKVTWHKHYLVFETPTRPDFTYGNSIFFLGSSLQENESFVARYKSEKFGPGETTAHFEYHFDYYTELPELKSYEDTEIVFEFKNSVSTSSIMPANTEFSIIEPEELINCISSLVFDEYSDGIPDDFLIWRLEDYRNKIFRLKGKWYGLYHSNELISTCGIFSSTDFTRFQMVITKKQYRRRGYGTLLLKSILNELDKDQKIIIVASEGSIASMMYPKIGFQRKSVILSTKI